jgi:hypothetical protein
MKSIPFGTLLRGTAGQSRACYGAALEGRRIDGANVHLACPPIQPDDTQASGLRGESLPPAGKQNSGADDQTRRDGRPCVAHGLNYELLDREPARAPPNMLALTLGLPTPEPVNNREKRAIAA